MAGIVTPIQDILNKIIAIGGGSPIFEFVRIWNNQFQQTEDGSTYSFKFPCAFVEAIPDKVQPVALGITDRDVIFKIHIGHQEMDAGDGNMEQNVNVFTFRDAIITALTYYEPTACSGLQLHDEEQDFTHDNIYHYIVSFKCSFVDDRGNQQAGQVNTTPPTNLIIDVTVEEDN